MDAELLQLKKLFEAAQEARVDVKLSERNVVELVTKLQKLSLLPADLLHTVSGREYLTQEQLRREMEIEIKRLGRVPLVDLAATIGVDLYHIESQAAQIVSGNSDLMLVQREILSTSYWDSASEEINENLQERAQVSLAELAAYLNVGAELLTAALEPRLGRLIHGKLEGGQLYTQSYVARIKAMIRGAVRAVMVPTNLSTLWFSIQQQIQEMDGVGTGRVPGEGVLFQTLLNGLLKEGAMLGSLQGGGLLWTPVVFAQAQHEGVESSYSQNSYITYDAVRKLAIPQPKQYLKAKYPEGIALETVFAHPSFISMVDAIAEEAIDEGGWVDVVSGVPSSFATQDVAKLLSLCFSVQNAEKESTASVMAETCIVSNVLIKSLIKRFEKEVQCHMKSKSVTDKLHSSNQLAVGENGIGGNMCQSRVRGAGSTLNEDSDTINLQKSGSAQGKTRRKKGTGAGLLIPAMENEQDETVSNKAMKGKRRAGKGKGGISSSTEAVIVSRGGKGNLDVISSNDPFYLSEEQMAAKILEWFPDMDSAATGEDGVGTLARHIALQLRDSVISYWKHMRQLTYTAAAEERRIRMDNLQNNLDQAYGNLQLFSKALDLFEDDKSTLAVLQRHLLRTTATEIADLVLLAQDVQRRLEDGEACEHLEIVAPASLSSTQRLSLAKSFPGSFSKFAIKMVEMLDGKTLEAFELSLEEVVTESGLRLKKLDKKSERSLLHDYRKRLVLEVGEETDPVSLLPKVVALLFVQVHNRALQAPGRAMSAAVICLKNKIPDASYTILLNYHSAAVALLSMMSTTSSATDCTSDRIQEKRELLESQMSYLKTIVLSNSGDTFNEKY